MPIAFGLQLLPKQWGLDDEIGQRVGRLNCVEWKSHVRMRSGVGGWVKLRDKVIKLTSSIDDAVNP